MLYDSVIGTKQRTDKIAALVANADANGFVSGNAGWDTGPNSTKGENHE
jgi:hypothetical protein